MSEKRIFQILELCLWILNPFMIFLAIFSQKIEPGLFLQWLGKMHPLILHFPIVFGVLIGIYFLFLKHLNLSTGTEKLILLINALFASAVAIFGLLLAKQNAYNGELITWHKWGGIAIAVMSWFFIYMLQLKTGFKKIWSVLFLIVLIGATHKGAQLTHGINALSFPKPSASETEVLVIDSSSTLYEAGIAPIFEQKCVGCHGPDKTKGDLRLDTPAFILKGGKDGSILNSEMNKKGILFERIHLPLSHDDHMPPDGKLQPTSDEIRLLSNWIKSGADFNLKLGDLLKEDSIYILATNLQSETKNNILSEKDLPDLSEFNTNYCNVYYVFNGSDKVVVNFFQHSFYNRESLKKLEKIKENIIELNMQGMPLQKEDLDMILKFENLQKLNLNFTGLDFKSLEAIKTLPNLSSLSICGIECDDSLLDKFIDKAKFTSLNVWTAGLDKDQLEALTLKYPNVNLIAGDDLENEIIKINDPVITQDSSVISNYLDVEIKHFLKDVDIRFTTDGTDPDSVKSNKYIQPIRLSEETILKAKAFKKGWLSSDIAQRKFFKSEIHPDTIFLLTSPNSKYRGDGAKTLVDYELGGNNRSNGKWLGYRNSDLEFVIGFKEAKKLHQVSFNSFIDIGAYIFPIRSIAVLGSNNGKQYQPVTEVSFPQAKKSDPDGVSPFTCDIPESTSFNYYKFIVSNLKKLPDWHPGKGEPAWVFVDELFLN